MKPTSLYPTDNRFAIQRVAIPRKGNYKITVPENYELIVCKGNKDTEFFGSGRFVEIKGRSPPSGMLYWMPLAHQAITYSKDGCKVQLAVRFFNPIQLINNSATSLDLRTMLKPLATHIDRLIATSTTTHGLRKSIENVAQDMIEPLGLDLVGEIDIENKERGM